MKETPETLTRGEWYKLTAGGDAEVVALLDGSEVLLTSQDGAEQNAPAFQAPTENIIVRTDAPYVILPCDAAGDGSGVNKKAVNELIADNNEDGGRTWNISACYVDNVFLTLAQKHWERPMPRVGWMQDTFNSSNIHYFSPEGGMPLLRVGNGAFRATTQMKWCICDFPLMYAANGMFRYSSIEYFRTGDISSLVYARNMFSDSKLDIWSILNVLNNLPDYSAILDDLRECEGGEIGFERVPDFEKYLRAPDVVMAITQAVNKGWKIHYTGDSGNGGYYPKIFTPSHLPVFDTTITLPPEPPAPKRWNQLTANVQMLTLPTL